MLTTRLFLVIAASLMLLGCGGGSGSGGATDTPNEAPDTTQLPADEAMGGDPGNIPVEAIDAAILPLLRVQDMTYAGAFTFPASDYGISSMNYSDGIIEQFGDTLFIVGHAHQEAIAQFRIPSLVVSEQIADLNSTGDPLQTFSTVLDRATGGNAEGSDQISGMEVVDGRLIINAHEWYDADGNNTDTTLVLADATRLASSMVEGYFDLPGAARAGGWISPIPSVWQTTLNGTYLTGFSSATSIMSRHSVGPSAHAIYPADVFGATLANPAIATTKLMEFSIAEPLHDDLLNETGLNDLWTHDSGAWYGFIVPGTRTYATFGSLAGRDSGVGYKITQDNSNICGGYCPREADDDYPYYWFFDVNDLVRVKAGELMPSEVRPYAHGVFPAPFQPAIGAHGIIGGSFDEDSGLLYLTLDKANTAQGPYARTPIIAAFKVAEPQGPQSGPH